MLAPALLSLALIAVVVSTIAGAEVAAVRTEIQRLALTYVAATRERAIDVLQQQLSAGAQTGSPFPLPTFAPLVPECADGPPCAYMGSATIALTSDDASGTPVQSCAAAAMRCAANEETDAYAKESRAVAVIVVTISGADGSVLVRRASDLVIRFVSVPPYALVGGAREGAFDDVVAADAAGDDGGLPPATPNPCAGSTPGRSDDTVVRVALVNAQSGACADGSSWRSVTY